MTKTVDDVNSLQTLAGQDDESLKRYEQISLIWQQLSPSEQRKLAHQQIQAVVYDPEQSKISVTLNQVTAGEFVHASPWHHDV